MTPITVKWSKRLVLHAIIFPGVLLILEAMPQKRVNRLAIDGRHTSLDYMNRPLPDGMCLTELSDQMACTLPPLAGVCSEGRGICCNGSCVCNTDPNPCAIGEGTAMEPENEPDHGKSIQEKGELLNNLFQCMRMCLITCITHSCYPIVDQNVCEMTCIRSCGEKCLSVISG
ncbi:uncharacterized protein LOC144135185 [Amblyomma americanum]